MQVKNWDFWEKYPEGEEQIYHNDLRELRKAGVSFASSHNGIASLFEGDLSPEAALILIRRFTRFKEAELAA